MVTDIDKPTVVYTPFVTYLSTADSELLSEKNSTANSTISANSIISMNETINVSNELDKDDGDRM